MRPDRRLLLAGALAAIVAPAGGRAATGFGAVSAPIADLDVGLLAVMKAGQTTPFPRRFTMLDPVIGRVFNLPRILSMVVGFDWPDIAAAQRQKLLVVFRQYTVASYVANFKSYNGQQFRILPGLRAVGSEQVVTTEIVPQNGSPTRIDYVMLPAGNSWQATDVLLDGTISQVAVQRSDFQSVLASGGAPGLIDALQNKIRSLSGGTLS